MGQILASLNLRGNDTIVPEINFDIESNVELWDNIRDCMIKRANAI